MSMLVPEVVMNFARLALTTVAVNALASTLLPTTAFYLVMDCPPLLIVSAYTHC